MYGTHMDISLRKEAEAALREASRLAEEASLAKSRFLANMSHEIRTPLNGVIGFADLMSRTRLDPLQHQYMKNIVHSANSLMDLINDVLDFLKIEAGRMELDPETVSLFSLCEDTADYVKLAAHAKNLELVVLVDPALPETIVADPVRLRQVLVNLTGNAVKFTESGTVTLEARLLERSEGRALICFSVTDSGIGISDEQRKKLFTSFSQADPSTTRKYGGTGLGLAISQRLLEKMGSRLDLASTPGQGSCFSFDLEVSTEWKPPATSGIEPGIRIALLTDHPGLQSAVKALAAGLGIGLDGAGSCCELLDSLEVADRPRLVIVDSSLKSSDPVECLRNIMNHASASGNRIPVCLLHRASEDPALFSRAQSLGVRHYLVKPPKRNELAEVTGDAIRRDTAYTEDTAGEAIAPSCPLVPHETVVVLIADDNEINCMLARSVVEGILPGSRIIEVNDGGSAVEAYRIHQPDLVLMDVQMPVKDGYAATVEIRTYEETIARRALIVALTAGTVKGERERCLMSGMDEYITKPFVSGTIENLVRRWMPGLLDHTAGPAARTAEVRKRFDRDALLARMAGDSEMYQRLLAEVPRVIPGYLLDLLDAVSAGDESHSRKRAHRIKGAALGMSFGILARLGQEIEMMEPWDPERARILAGEMDAEFRAVLALVEEEARRPTP